MTLSLSIPAENLSRTLVSSRSVSQSPFSLTTNQQLWGGHRWEYDIRVPSGSFLEQSARTLGGQLNLLSSTGQAFVLADPTCLQPRFSATVVTLSESCNAGQSDISLSLTGSTFFQVGDFLSFDRGDGKHDFHQVVIAESPVGNLQSVGIVPPLRRAYAISKPAEVLQPLVTLILRPEKHPQNFSYPFQVQYTVAALESF